MGYICCFAIPHTYKNEENAIFMGMFLPEDA